MTTGICDSGDEERLAFLALVVGGLRLSVFTLTILDRNFLKLSLLPSPRTN
jgi:hypothetical protein